MSMYDIPAADFSGRLLGESLRSGTGAKGPKSRGEVCKEELNLEVTCELCKVFIFSLRKNIMVLMSTQILLLIGPKFQIINLKRFRTVIKFY